MTWHQKEFNIYLNEKKSSLYCLAGNNSYQVNKKFMTISILLLKN